jgi:hypothetical protein
MAEGADIASDAINVARIAAVSAAVGPQRMAELMQILGARVEHLVAAADMFPECAEDCLFALHQSRGSAASLGFLALAEGLARMEALGRQVPCDLAALRRAGRALPGLWAEAVQAKEALLF